MIRARFNIRFRDCDNDFRPVKWPIKYPYWRTGEDSDSFILVAYVDDMAEIRELWPEAYNIKGVEVQEIKFTSRFPRPEWY